MRRLKYLPVVIALASWFAANTNDFGYGSQGQAPAGQIGDGQGVANWGTSQGNIKPAYPVQRNSASGDGTGRLPGFFSGKPVPDWPVPSPIYKTRQFLIDLVGAAGAAALRFCVVSHRSTKR